MRKARSIFQNIYLSEETTEEKVDAIRKVIGMETHNSFTKQEFINVLDWLLNEHPKHNGWIPCSERLPEEAGDYLVTQYTEKSIFDYCDAYRVSTIFFDDKNGWWDDIDNSCGWNIIAWQPLPLPYKKG